MGDAVGKGVGDAALYVGSSVGTPEGEVVGDAVG